MGANELQAFNRGIELFNSGEFWHAHEAWEQVWLALDEDAEIIIRGLIQCAAARHLLRLGREEGARSNFQKAVDKLSLASPVWLGLDIASMVEYIRSQIEALDPSVRFEIRRATG
jgi:predicted metal-dependent hydrolase